MGGEDKNSVAKHLSAMGYIPISIEESKELGFGLPKLFGIFNKVAIDDLNLFTRQLTTLQKAGIPLLSSLNILEKQAKNKYFKDVIKEISGLVESGSSLSDAMARYPKIFSELYVNMVKAGEASGLLDEILTRLSEFGEKEADTRSKVQVATRYPIMTLFALFVAFMIIVTFVIPKFSAVFAQFKTALPLPTRMLLGLSVFLKNYWYLAILGITGCAYLFIRYINTKDGRLRWDTVKLKAPVFGQLFSMFAMARFSRTMSILIKSGLPILQVLDLSSRTVANTLISRSIDNVAMSVKEGKGISEPMRISGLFPPIVVSMVGIGEDTGKIDELLMRVSEYYDQQSDYMIKNLTTMIEPILIVFLGAMILVMALAIFLPMWNLISLFNH